MIFSEVILLGRKMVKMAKKNTVIVSISMPIEQHTKVQRLIESSIGGKFSTMCCDLIQIGIDAVSPKKYVRKKSDKNP